MSMSRAFLVSPGVSVSVGRMEIPYIGFAQAIFVLMFKEYSMQAVLRGFKISARDNFSHFQCDQLPSRSFCWEDRWFILVQSRRSRRKVLHTEVKTKPDRTQINCP